MYWYECTEYCKQKFFIRERWMKKEKKVCKFQIILQNES